MTPDSIRSLDSTEGLVKVTPNEAAAFAVRLSGPAPAGGVTVTLKSSDTSKVTVTPASVVIPPGATTPPTQPQVTGTGVGSATISATATGYISGAGAVTVTAPTMAFSGSPLVIAIGGTGNLMLNLAGGQAPAGGLTVNLSSSDASKVKVPGTVSFAAGATSVSVPVTGVTPGLATITATTPNIANATASVTVTPPPTVSASYGANFLQLINVVLTNASGVTAVNLRVTSVTNVTSIAPNVIALLPNVIIPMPYGNLAGGQAAVRSFSFGAAAGSIEVPFSFIITYQADNMPSQTAVIDVPFPRSMSFAGSPLAISAGASGNLTLKLLGNQAPAGGLTVTLSSSDPGKASVPATVSFAPGSTSVTVPVAGLAPGSAVITASATVVNFAAIATASVNITGAISSPANTSVKLGQSVSFGVTLSAPAPAGGVTVTLKSSDTSKVTVTPANVVIPQGATTPTTQPQVTGAGIGAATITAAATGYTAGTGAVTVTAPTMAFTGSPLVIALGSAGNLTLSLTGGQAPAGGLTVNLSSSDASKAEVPGTVSFAGGAASVTVPVTGVTPGTVAITASVTGIVSATTSVTVTPPPTVIAAYGINSPQVLNLSLINTSEVTAINVRITSLIVTAPAPNVIVPPDNGIPAPYGTLAGGAGRTLVWAFRATKGSLDVPFTLTMTIEADNMAPRTVVVDVPFPRAMSFFASPLALATGAAGNLTLNLTGNQAPAGGLTVSLRSSDLGRATVPSTVTFAAGATTVSVPVNGLAAGSAVITASANINLFFSPATATAIVNVGGGR
jgi:hypothetical protein